MITGSGAIVLLIIAVLGMDFAQNQSRTGFGVVAALQAHECPGGPVTGEIPAKDVVLLRGSYDGRLGRWREVTWDATDHDPVQTREGWVLDEELRQVLGGAGGRLRAGTVVADPTFDAGCAAAARGDNTPAVLGTVVTPTTANAASANAATTTAATANAATTTAATTATTAIAATTAASATAAPTTQPAVTAAAASVVTTIPAVPTAPTTAGKVGVATTAPPKQTAPAKVCAAEPASGLTADDLEALGLINQLRASLGLVPVTPDKEAQAVAVAQSIKMAQAGALSHADLNQFCGPPPAVHEDVAKCASVQQCIEILQADPQHKAFMTDPRTDRVGISVVTDGQGNVWMTLDFLGRD